jgi:hypothetical protein
VPRYVYISSISVSADAPRRVGLTREREWELLEKKSENFMTP